MKRNTRSYIWREIKNKQEIQKSEIKDQKREYYWRTFHLYDYFLFVIAFLIYSSEIYFFFDSLFSSLILAVIGLVINNIFKEEEKQRDVARNEEKNLL